MIQRPVNEIDFEQELFKTFGQVKDFTLAMEIAKWFYDLGRKHREPTNELLSEAVEAKCLMLSYPDLFKVLLCPKITDKLANGDKVKLITLKNND